MDKKLSLILACTLDGGIGIDNNIPWHVPEDLRKFRQITSKVPEVSGKMNALIMGRNTWDSLPRRPLMNRMNIILTRDKYFKTPYRNTVVLHSIPAALMYCYHSTEIEDIYVIGGTSLFNEFITNENYIELIDKIYLSIMFSDNTRVTNKHIDIEFLFKNFVFEKDANYKKESDDRLFASYICKPRLPKLISDIAKPQYK